MPEVNPYARFLNSAVTPQDIVEALAATPNALADLAAAIGPDRIDVSPAPGKWSATQILCHIADCEIAFAFRLRQVLAEEHHVMQPFDQDLWAATYAGIQAGEALAAFAALRKWNLLFLQRALPGAAEKPVTHPERGTMTFSTILETMAGHDRNHTLQLQALADRSR